MRWLTVSFCCLVTAVLLLAGGAVLVLEDRFPAGSGCVGAAVLLLVISRMVRHHGGRKR